jgi:hypothetical protein
MKKFISLIVLLSCCGWLTAQTPKNIFVNDNNKIFFGLSFGPTVDWFTPVTKEFTLERTKAKAGFIAGIHLDVNLIKSKMLYFSTGVLFRYLEGDLAFVNRYRFYYSDSTFYTRDLSTVRTYKTMYIAIPAGIKFRTIPAKNCVFTGKIGLYHHFKVGGTQMDSFEDPLNYMYNYTTKKIKNTDASLFAEAGYFGLGFEYAFTPALRLTAGMDYSCQFNYFSNKAINEIAMARYKSIIHSLQIMFGVIF